jgi:hypothetical protein
MTETALPFRMTDDGYYGVLDLRKRLTGPYMLPFG